MFGTRRQAKENTRDGTGLGTLSSGSQDRMGCGDMLGPGPLGTLRY